jgi:hypothetical protein
MIPLFQIFWNKIFKKVWILEYLGCFTKSIVVSILDFDTSLFRKMFKLLTCKRNHNFEFRVLCSLIHNWITRWAPCSLTDSQIHGLIKTGRFFENPLVGRHVLNVFYLKDFVTWQVCEMLSDISLGGFFYVAFATTTLGRHVLWFKIKYMASGIKTRTFGCHVLISFI